MNARLKLLLLAVALTLSIAGAARSEGFQSAAPDALLVDYESGATLYEKNADVQFPASALVKLMTAELVFRETQGRAASSRRHVPCLGARLADRRRPRPRDCDLS